MDNLKLIEENNAWVLGIMLLVVLFLLLTIRRSAWGSFLVSIYLSFAITIKAASFLFKTPLAKTIFFIISGIIIFSIFRQLFVVRIGGKKIWLWVKMILLSLATTGLLASLFFGWYVKKGDTSDFLLQWFVSAPAQLFWMVGPLVLLILFKSRK